MSAIELAELIIHILLGYIPSSVIDSLAISGKSQVTGPLKFPAHFVFQKPD